ncbi:LytR/AlgR family response regulator transcription factor [Moheibacter sediminis]|uniref:Two component transcriptional regulator, LytTR family n=1 Tax=Moheibacter sediminis TaxID=1434700 RepID=A0A1W2BUZ0_9FLAO|nr:LytTR family DNA-binding domain-containing protein [Moheibacter sediminis]SMC76815.1 two component transcriptional regulator, LytTR family [Moheibacter sediminis]
MKSIIIEDEKPAARYLLRMLQNQGIEPIVMLHSVKEAVQWFKENPEPDLIFLDIQLGDGISFEIFEQVQPKSSIIFTTAYDEYALKAFKFNSIDYLLKPINEIDLKRAIAKFNEKSTPVLWDAFQLKSLLVNNFENKYRERFLVKIGSNLKTIDTENISCFYSKNKGTYLCHENREYPIEQTLNDLESQLNPNDFFRISRNAIVNLRFIENIATHSGSRYNLFVKNVEEELIVSRERVNDFKTWLEK